VIIWMLPPPFAAGGGGEERGLHFRYFQRVERHGDVVAQAAVGVHRVGGVDAVDGDSVVGGARTVNAGVERLAAIVALGAGVAAMLRPRPVRSGRGAATQFRGGGGVDAAERYAIQRKSAGDHHAGAGG